MNLSEAEEVAEIHRTDLYDPDNHNGVITHLQPDILECEVKWALGNTAVNKASGCDGNSISRAISNSKI